MKLVNTPCCLLKLHVGDNKAPETFASLRVHMLIKWKRNVKMFTYYTVRLSEKVASISLATSFLCHSSFVFLFCVLQHFYSFYILVLTSFLPFPFLAITH